MPYTYYCSSIYDSSSLDNLILSHRWQSLGWPKVAIYCSSTNYASFAKCFLTLRWKDSNFFIQIGILGRKYLGRKDIPDFRGTNFFFLNFINIEFYKCWSDRKRPYDCHLLLVFLESVLLNIRTRDILL